MVDQPRPVWLTREQRDMVMLAAEVFHDFDPPNGSEHLYPLVAAWDAAPADAAQAVRLLLTSGLWTRQRDDLNEEWVSAMANAVLRTLGAPDA